MKHEIIQQGAEATIYKIGNKVAKERLPKGYRLEKLDNKLRIRRSRKEAKLMTKASEIINCPKPLKIKDKYQIKIPFIDGKKLSDHLDDLKNSKEICEQIGEQIGILHDNNIIHGDLTTSNMILVENKNKESVKSSDSTSPEGVVPEISEGNLTPIAKVGDVEAKTSKVKNQNNLKVFFIDFGLGYESIKVEDKAVDLHLIKHALEARHYKNWEESWKSIQKGYKKSKYSKEVLERLKVVESRGRYKERY
jgi:tRNA A-37 threonylcarbamoyl transferase component Bud32